MLKRYCSDGNHLEVYYKRSYSNTWISAGNIDFPMGMLNFAFRGWQSATLPCYGLWVDAVQHSLNYHIGKPASVYPTLAAGLKITWPGESGKHYRVYMSDDGGQT